MRNDGVTALTIAICTYNRAAFLRRALEALLPQVSAASTSVRVMVVDNASTDDTKAVVLALGSAVEYVLESQQGLSWARNCALRSTTSSWVLFLDDDAVPAEGWVEAAEAAICDFPDAGAFGGPIVPDFAAPPPSILTDAFVDAKKGFCELRHPHGRGLLPAPLEIYGGNFAVRRNACPGLRFDTKLGRSGRDNGIGEDTKFVLDLRARGCPIVWIPDLVIRHHVDPSRLTLAYLLGYRRALGLSLGLMSGPDTSVTAFGVPRWILRRQIEVAGRILLALVRRRRVSVLSAIGDLEFHRGMVDAFRQRRSPRVDRWAIRQLDRWIMRD